MTLSVLVSYDTSQDRSHHNWMSFRLFYKDHLQQSSKFSGYTDGTSTSSYPNTST